MARKDDRKYREIFFAANGFGPYTCVECKEEVYFNTVTVHHENHDETDHGIENLVPMHKGCHISHHMTTRDVGKKASEETKAKMRESQKNRWANMSDEERSSITEKMSASMKKSEQGRNLAKAWETRRQRYGPNGMRSPEKER